MNKDRKGSHSVYSLQVHLVWCTKYRYQVLEGETQKRCRDLIKQGCDALKKHYWGGHFWGIGYGCWSVGNITDELLQQYLDHHKESPNGDENFILE